MPLASPAIQAMIHLIEADDHAPRFPIRLVIKDLKYALAAGNTGDDNANGLLMIRQCLQLFERASKGGLTDRNITAISHHAVR